MPRKATAFLITWCNDAKISWTIEKICKKAPENGTRIILISVMSKLIIKRISRCGFFLNLFNFYFFYRLNFFSPYSVSHYFVTLFIKAGLH